MSARKRPLYARMLRLRHLTLRPAVAFLLFEGSIGLGLLLALAEIVNGWGIVAVPVTVAVMVKLNDIVAGALDHVPPVAPVGVPSVVSAEARVPPQNRATQPGRGASMRRTRAIVGRARLGTARGIVYVHSKPGSTAATSAIPAPPATAEPAARAETQATAEPQATAAPRARLADQPWPEAPTEAPTEASAAAPADAPAADGRSESETAEQASARESDVSAALERRSEEPGAGDPADRSDPYRTDRNKGRFA